MFVVVGGRGYPASSILDIVAALAQILPDD